MLNRLNWLWALLAGTLIPLSLAPYDIWPASIVGLFILLGLLHSNPIDTSAKGFIIGWWFGLGIFGVGTSWVYVSIHDYGHAPVALAVFLTSLFCMGLALLSGFTCYIYKRFFPNWNAVQPLVFAALWALGEWLRSWLLTGFPWLYIGYAQVDGPLSAWAPIGGVLSISFVIALLSASLYSLSTKKHYYSATAIIACIIICSIGFTQIQWVEAQPQRVSVALVQANIDQNEKWLAAKIPEHIALQEKMTEPLWGHDVIVWPESAIPQLMHTAEPLLGRLQSKAQQHASTLITGIPYFDQEQHSYHNSIISLDQQRHHYLKRRLVPFGEYVPLQDLLRGLISFFDLPMSNFRPGPVQQDDLRAGSLTLAPLICYEVVYPDMIRRGAGQQADLLLTISNDTWFGKSIGPLQHLQMARMRALETGRAMIRGTNNGVSALIDADGQVTHQSAQFKREVLTGDVTVYTGDTLVSQFGHRPLLAVCWLVLLLAYAKAYLRQMHSRK